MFSQIKDEKAKVATANVTSFSLRSTETKSAIVRKDHENEKLQPERQKAHSRVA